MKRHHIISIVLIPLLATGCAMVRPVTDIAAGAGGGALASNLSHGNAGITAAGAAGGVLVSEGANYLVSKAADNAYTTGYEKAEATR